MTRTHPHVQHALASTHGIHRKSPARTTSIDKLTFGTTRNVAWVTTPNKPYPPMTWRNSFTFSSRLHVTTLPSACTTSMSTMLSTSASSVVMPCAFTAMLPPTLNVQ